MHFIGNERLILKIAYLLSYLCNQSTESIFPAIHFDDSDTVDDFTH